MLSHLLRARFALAISLAAAPLSSAANAPDYSKEAIVIQEMATKVIFSANGTREWQQKFSARIQSEAMVQQFGVLSFSYNADSEHVQVEYVRVKKPDGSVIETPASNAMDVATEVARVAPTYSDLREKQMPVKGLAVGDVLEYSIRSSQSKPEVPGHFWYEQAFIDDGVVLSQTLEIRVPKNKYVQVSSPKLTGVTREEGDQRVYVWSHSHLEPSKPAQNKNSADADQPLKVQLTTFKSWEEVGSWWGALASEQQKVTPAVQAKANELTTGLSTDAEKARAIYKYVALKFRYISISFGAGRYRPHTADEVLANQYGDCKDKHTLFAALLKAAGIQAWPALIGAGIKFDSSVPSPAQFNHVITVLPQDGKYVWLDTTAEVAPFGFLVRMIRDQQALVIPATGKPFLQKTPLDPPFPSSETLDVKSSLSADGALTGHFSFRMSGDNAVAMRAVLRQLAPAQWQVFAQQVCAALGYPGDVSGVDIENLDDLDKPLHFAYDYKGKGFSDWDNHRITAPMPPMGFGAGEQAEKPKEPFSAGVLGQLAYRASVEVPKGFSVELPQDAKLTSDFADYSSHYALKDGTLAAERTLVIKKSKVPVEQWSEYQKLSKGVRNDQAQYIVFTDRPTIEKRPPSNDNPEARALVMQAFSSMQTRDFNAARDLLRQAEGVNPKQSGLWAGYAYLEQSSGHLDQAIADYRKELEYSPYETPAYEGLATLLVQADRRDEAMDLLRVGVSKQPSDASLAFRLASMLLAAKQYAEILPLLEKPSAAAPQDFRLQVLRVQALLGLGRKDEATAEALKIASATSDSVTLNDLAYFFADTDTDLAAAQGLAERSMNQIEQDCSKASLTHFENRDLQRVNELSAVWDTVGWIRFKHGDLAGSERYVDAAWQLSQLAEVADHLGEIYDKQGRHTAAIHMWRLALVANSRDEGAKEHLRKAGVSILEPVHISRKAANQPTSGGEELGKLRTVGVPALPKQTGSAEFFILVSQHGFEDVQFVNGLDGLKSAAPAIEATKYEFPFPDSGAEKIIRRGILSCSQYTTPSCQLTLLLPSTVRKAAH